MRIDLSGSIAILISTCALALTVSACGSSSATKATTEPRITPPETLAAPRLTPAMPKFNFYLSGSGKNGSDMDAFTMDTNRMMSVKTAHRNAKGEWVNLNALAELDPPDYDSLANIIRLGNLVAIDSNDITQQCAGDELFVLVITPASPAIKPLRVGYQGCAADYNLLLEPQRRYFRKLMDWFEKMRVKYRPIQPE